MQLVNESRAMYWSKVIAVGLVVGFGLQLVQAWTGPTQPPPNGNVSGPITTSATGQTKAGDLTIGNDFAVSRNSVLGTYVSVSNTTGLCLSGVCHTTWPGVSDAVPTGAIMMFMAACPSGWSEVTQLRNKFARGESTGNAGDLGSGGSDDAITVAHNHTVDPPSTVSSSGGDHYHNILNSAAATSISGWQGITYLADNYSSFNDAYNLGGNNSQPDVGRSSTGGSHTHTTDIASFDSGSAGASGVGANVPGYVEVIFCSKD